MATNTLFFEALTSGQKTIEYKKVLANLNKIIRALDLKTGAKKSLRLKFMEKRWLDITDDPSSEELVMVVLERIEHDSGQYHEFIAMVEDTPGLDLIRTDLKDTTFPQQESYSDQRASSSSSLGTTVGPPTSSVADEIGYSYNRSLVKSKPEMDDLPYMIDTGTNTKLPEKQKSHSKIDATCKVLVPQQNIKPLSGEKTSPYSDFHSPSYDKKLLSHLEAPPVQPSDTHATLPSLLITGGETDHQYEETVGKMVKLAADAIQKEKEEVHKLNEKVRNLEEELKTEQAKVDSIKEELDRKNKQLKDQQKEMAQDKQEKAEWKRKYETTIADKKKLEILLEKEMSSFISFKQETIEKINLLQKRSDCQQKKIEKFECQNNELLKQNNELLQKNNELLQEQRRESAQEHSELLALLKQFTSCRTDD